MESLSLLASSKHLKSQRKPLLYRMTAAYKHKSLGTSTNLNCYYVSNDSCIQTQELRYFHKSQLLLRISFAFNEITQTEKKKKKKHQERFQKGNAQRVGLLERRPTVTLYKTSHFVLSLQLQRKMQKIGEMASLDDDNKNKKRKKTIPRVTTRTQLAENRCLRNLTPVGTAAAPLGRKSYRSVH